MRDICEVSHLTLHHRIGLVIYPFRRSSMTTSPTSISKLICSLWLLRSWSTTTSNDTCFSDQRGLPGVLIFELTHDFIFLLTAVSPKAASASYITNIGGIISYMHIYSVMILGYMSRNLSARLIVHFLFSTPRNWDGRTITINVLGHIHMITVSFSLWPHVIIIFTVLVLIKFPLLFRCYVKQLLKVILILLDLFFQAQILFVW